ncbi:MULTISPECIES: dUTP diphosphatase [Bacillaceae]|jgi:dUTP pyrophosphatase|uniref:Deoxyuridine 5'-triphosphate nucleotidohydrolase n=1 Tax=Caldibacillus thermoamylovorans TaxID=35841 RepID=A0A090J311_9BACI|nr:MULTISPECIES: dUTP diphosphatase [Bacillaceae]MCB5933418.1 dUTP diphosphatase [Bacillus sp. DFI.2.34]NWN96661.1 dUTP diphosphatase [Bacillus sp. (in: firmicutes)]AWI13065.1 dUTP diphosphatase [Caldibacillus thermoamylovorans]KIO62683.1 Deoxyuridine 5'-triphosphate nucleotidohydrolase [Caldibacillus thermoamylovorans]KIO65030.1 Deoxyuridine 5'-triphosphate nucleotidohydrolase [Caldibacillus thermoamylovorans]
MNDQLKVKLIKEDAKLPQYANPGDAGLDLFSVEEKIIKPGEFELISTGISLELPPGTEAQVRPRSGLALKHGITLLNSPGTIDEGYRGEVKVMLINHGKKEFKVEKHMRIAQMVVAPVTRMNVIEVEEISDSVRGEGGFGSTGW